MNIFSQHFARISLGISVTALLVLVIASPSGAQSEKHVPKRRVTPDEKRHLDEMEAKLRKLLQADNYVEGIAAAEAILDFFTRVQGADSWSAVTNARRLRTLRRIASLPPAARADIRQAGSLEDEARKHGRKQEYELALPLVRRAVELRQCHLGEEDEGVSSLLCQTGICLANLSQVSEAEAFFRRAHHLDKTIYGEGPATARSSLCLANILNTRGEHVKSEPLYRRSLEIHRRVFGEEIMVTQMAYSDLADCLVAQGQFAVPEEIYRRALKAFEKGGAQLELVQVCGNLGRVFTLQKKYGDAEPLLRRALEVSRAACKENHPVTANCYGKLAEVLNAQGRYAEAQEMASSGVKIHQACGAKDTGAPDTYESLAIALEGQGKYDLAEPLWREALALRKLAVGERNLHTVDANIGLGLNMQAQRRLPEAEALLQKAAFYFDAVLPGVRFGGVERAYLFAGRTPWQVLAACQARAGKWDDAWQSYERNLARGLLDDLTEQSLGQDERRLGREMATQLDQLDRQISVLASSQNAAPEAKSKLEGLRRDRDSRQSELAQWKADLVAKHGPTAGKVYELNRIQARLPADAALVAWFDFPLEPRKVDPNEAHWACIVRHSGRPVWIALDGSGPRGTWTDEDRLLAQQAREAFACRPEDRTNSVQELTRRLNAQRLAPLKAHLEANTVLPATRHLIVLPGAGTAGVPVEALTDEYTVSYAPSGTIFAWLQEKRSGQKDTAAKTAGPMMLALGDPVFVASSKEGTATDRSREDAWLHRTRGSSFVPLPGTRLEVKEIGRLFPSGKILLGSEASEQELSKLAASGSLESFRYLHLATHAEMDDQIPMRSALILAQDQLPDPLKQVLADGEVIDGRLTADQVLRTWKLEAELVTLSACQTGLGRYSGGEGHVGFAQAFFLAGARSLVVSLWKVDDTATAVLMVRFYQNLLGKRDGLRTPLAKAEALREAKSWLRGLTAADVAAIPGRERGTVRTRQTKAGAAPVHPFDDAHYWSAFILIGDPN